MTYSHYCEFKSSHCADKELSRLARSFCDVLLEPTLLPVLCQMNPVSILLPLVILQQYL